VNRRRFLQGLGVGSAALALSPRVFAEGEGEAPKRLILLSTGHGSVYEHWRMGPGGYFDGRLSQMDFSRSYAPLQDIASRTTVIEGLSMASAELDLAGYRHEKGWVHAWTGGWALLNASSVLSTLPSLDQRVAAAIGRSDRLLSLELSIGEGRPTAHAGYAQQLPMEEDPQRVFNRLFGAGDDPFIGQTGSVLDYALAEFDALAPKLSAIDRERMETHYGLVRQLEQRLVGLAQAGCDGPVASSASGYDTLFDAHSELVGAAFACDLTRVVTMSLGDLPTKDFGWGNGSGDAHMDFAHEIYNRPDAALAMGDYVGHHAKQLARLVQLLESIPDSDGRSVMDNTLIVWSSELADGWHGYENLHAVLVGGDWAWPGDRYLSSPYGEVPIELIAPGGQRVLSGLPHQHLLVSVAQAMGLDLNAVGLERLESRAGDRVDVTGPIPGLFA